MGRAMELRHLRFFVAVAEEGSLTVAAERRLHTAQPSLSRQMRDLEYEVGAQLMIRSARGIELTAAGRVFLDHARLALAQVDAAGEAARRAAQPAKPSFALGFLTGKEIDWLPEAIRLLRDELPNIERSRALRRARERRGPRSDRDRNAQPLHRNPGEEGRAGHGSAVGARGRARRDCSRHRVSCFRQGLIRDWPSPHRRRRQDRGLTKEITCPSCARKWHSLPVVSRGIGWRQRESKKRSRRSNNTPASRSVRWASQARPPSGIRGAGSTDKTLRARG